LEKEEEKGNKMKKMKKGMKNSLLGGDALNSGKYLTTFEI